VDGFKTVVLTTLLVSIAAIGFIAYVIGDVIENAKIPDQQYGTVSAMDPVTDGHPAKYIVTLEDDRQLYITTNTTTYETIELNKAYLFSCRIDAKNHMIIIDSAWQTNRTAT
jgi:hypothetical protein